MMEGKLNNQKLLVKPEDLASEDVSGYRGIFFTDASMQELSENSKEWFKFSEGVVCGKLDLSESQEPGYGTTLRISANKPKFEELADLVSRGFVTRVDCLGAGEQLHHIEDVVKNILSQGKKVVLFPFDKNKIKPRMIVIIHGC